MTGQPQPLDLDEIEARANAATPGPWFNDSHEIYAGENTDIPAMSEWIGETCDPSRPDHGAANAAFIAAARTDVPTLLAEIRRLTAELQQAQQQTADRIAAELATVDPPEWAFAGQYGGQDAIRIARAVGAGCNCENADEPGHYVEHLTNAPRVTPCRAPHPVADSARCELPTAHRGWHAADVGSWPSSNWPPTTAPAAPSGA